jgi:hypothetical protein
VDTAKAASKNGILRFVIREISDAGFLKGGGSETNEMRLACGPAGGIEKKVTG